MRRLRGRLPCLATIAAVALGAVAARAHHGGAIEWNRDVAGPITGTATQFVFRFPHVVVHMDVAGPDGEVERWAFVTRWTPTVLRDWGWSRNSIEAGDELTMTYATHVSQPRMGNMLSIDVNGEPLPLGEE